MKNRIRKKIHKRYLPDVGIEITMNSKWESILSDLEVSECAEINKQNIPESFYRLNPEAKSRTLSYEVQRVELQSVPRFESHWWQVNSNTRYFSFYPISFKQSKWHAAVDLAK
ncbi:MAG: hypothetical protein GY699_08860 [Desulfobacteraceae bacterium]|nr:hypothetical protein [Desulfobacteraceae bacterium]